MAQYELSNERKSHTLSATALVNEAYLKLSKQIPQLDLELADLKDGGGFASSAKRRFFAAAARAMRQILVDYARTRRRKKRGGGRHASTEFAFDQIAADSALPIVDLLALDEALAKLTDQSPEVAKVVEMRFFAGLPEATIADTMGISERTVRRHWTFAKAWLTREMRQPD